MKCFFCKKIASALCKFCGRAICDNHRVIGPISLINALNLKDELIERNFDPHLF